MDHGAHGSHLVGSSLNRVALSATAHCLAGCSVGEIAGMMIGSAAGLGNWTTVTLSIALAFVSGYSLTLLPLLRDGLSLRRALLIAFAADTASIGVMEIVDNAVMIAVPGAMDAGLLSLRFWLPLIGSLVLAGLAAFPVNRWLIARGRGHACAHRH